MRDDENDRPAWGKKDPLEIETKKQAHYGPFDAFSSFTREELIESVRMWINKCDKAEADQAELLHALRNLVDAAGPEGVNLDIWIGTALAAIAKAEAA